MFQELKATCSNPPAYLVAQMAWEQNQGVPLQAQCLISCCVNTGGHLLPPTRRKIPLFGTHPSSYAGERTCPEWMNSRTCYHWRPGTEGPAPCIHSKRNFFPDTLTVSSQLYQTLGLCAPYNWLLDVTVEPASSHPDLWLVSNCLGWPFLT